MTAPAPPDPLETARALTTALGDTALELKRLRRYGKRNRLLVGLDVALTVGLAASGALAVHSNDIAAQAAAAQQAFCQASNVARAQQVTVDDHLLTIVSPPHLTAAERAARAHALAKINAYLHSVYKPRDCAKLGQAGGPATRIPAPERNPR